MVMVKDVRVFGNIPEISLKICCYVSKRGVYLVPCNKGGLLRLFKRYLIYWCNVVIFKGLLCMSDSYCFFIEI